MPGRGFPEKTLHIEIELGGYRLGRQGYLEGYGDEQDPDFHLLPLYEFSGLDFPSLPHGNPAADEAEGGYDGDDP